MAAGEPRHLGASVGLPPWTVLAVFLVAVGVGGEAFRQWEGGTHLVKARGRGRGEASSAWAAWAAASREARDRHVWGGVRERHAGLASPAVRRWLSPGLLGMARLSVAAFIFTTLGVRLLSAAGPTICYASLVDGKKRCKVMPLVGTFTVWNWVLQGAYFTLAGACSLHCEGKRHRVRGKKDSAKRKAAAAAARRSARRDEFEEDLYRRLGSGNEVVEAAAEEEEAARGREEDEVPQWVTRATWLLYELGFANALLVSSVVWLVLVPAIRRAGDALALSQILGWFSTTTHVANLGFMVFELLVNRLPFRAAHYPFVLYFGAAYTVFAAWLYERTHVWFYFFLDYNLPALRAVLNYAALLVALTAFFVLGTWISNSTKRAEGRVATLRSDPAAKRTVRATQKVEPKRA